MSFGRSIRIFLADGTFGGIRHAEIVNWTGQAIYCPRVSIAKLAQWEESIRPGVYFLFGDDPDGGGDAAYIGEAENVYARIVQQVKAKEFWNEVIFFTSKDENLTKGHIKYLEAQLVAWATEAKRYVIVNGNSPTMSSLPRADKAAMNEFLGSVKILLSVLGHRILDPITQHTLEQASKVSDATSIQLSSSQPLASETLYLQVKNIDARAVQTEEGIVVLGGSTVASKTGASLSKGYAAIRKQLVTMGLIGQVEGSKLLEFTEDYLFTSPSQAAAVIVGYPMNGREAWKTIHGKTLKEIEELSLEAVEE